MARPQEHAAILHYIKTLRTLARDDKLLSREAWNADWREVARQNRRRRLLEAWKWRFLERGMRGTESASTILLRAQLAESKRLETWVGDVLEAAENVGADL